MRIDLVRPLPWILIALALSACFAVRLEFSPDSMHYVDIARNVASGNGLSTYHLHVYTQSVPDRVLFWPPAYPLLLAALIKIGLNALWAVRLVLILSFVATSAAIYHIGKMFSSRTVGITCLVIWLAIAPRLNIWSYAWSEPLFIAFSAAFVLSLGRAARNSFNPGWMLLAGALGGLATMCRYTGATTLVAALISLAYLIHVTRPRRSLLLLLRSALLVLLGFAVVTTPWFMHNRSLTGSIMGIARPPSIISPVESIARMAGSLGSDLVLPLGVMALLLALGGARREAALTSLRGLVISADNPIIIISGVWILTYCATLLLLASTYEFDPIGTRLTSPIYIVLIPLLMHVGYGIYTGSPGLPNRLSALGLRLVFLLLVASAIITFGARLELLRRDRAHVSATEHWIKQATPANSLFVAIEAWWIRFKTGRPVLESADMEDLTPQKVSGFLSRFGHHFPAVYLLSSQAAADDSDMIREYAGHGYSLSRGYVDGHWTVYEILREPR